MEYAERPSIARGVNAAPERESRRRRGRRHGERRDDASPDRAAGDRGLGDHEHGRARARRGERDADAAQLPGADAKQQLAYGLGCSTTVDTLRVMSDFDIPYPAIWWLDVEETNSWDDGDPGANRYSILGQIDQLAATGKTVAVYSDFPDWKQITGGPWGDPRIAGNWVAGKSPQDACSHSGFSGAPVWLAQELATWPGSGYDSDYAC